jgi:hypothetical protein
MTDQPANARGEQTYLFQAWGETDLPFAAIAVGRQQVQDFIVSEWLGDPESDEIPGIMQEFDAHGFGDGPLKWEFEIGGVRITKVYTHERTNEPTPNARPAMPVGTEPNRNGRNESVVGEAVAAPLGVERPVAWVWTGDGRPSIGVLVLDDGTRTPPALIDGWRPLYTRAAPPSAQQVPPPSSVPPDRLPQVHPTEHHAQDGKDE